MDDSTARKELAWDDAPGNERIIPRPEHPRPDLRRQAWLNLNGWWAFDFDPEDRGEKEGWFRRQPPGFSDRILVPFPWESLMAWGEGDQASDTHYYSKKAYINPDEVQHVDAIVFRSDAGDADYRVAPRHTIGWYCREFDVPSDWMGKRVYLTIGAADFYTKVWVNGEYVGEHAGGYLPFDFDVTPHLHEDRANVVTIRVYDAQVHEDQPGGKQHHWYQRTSGIWQTVYLEARSATAFVRHVHVSPDITKGLARFDIQIDDASNPGMTVRVTVTSPENECFASRVELDAGVVSTVVQVGTPTLWEPDNPQLYDATIELVGPNRSVEDRVETYFGMRTIGVGPLPGTDIQYVYLNGKPLYIRGVLDQAFHPAGLYSYPTDDVIRNDILAAKKVGFNMIRIHIKVQDPRYLYWADREGILIMADIPNFGYKGYSERAKTWWEQIMRGTIGRDYNHPAVFSWCLFNETWGVDKDFYATSPDRQEWVRSMYHAAKALDATRIIEDMSANRYDHVETDLNSWHFYINRYDDLKAHVDRVVAETHPGSPFNYVGGNVQHNEPLMNSEYGGIAAHDGDKDTAWFFKMHTNELRLHEKISGYVFTELTDLEWEHNGFLRYDRTPKDFGYPPAWINAADFVAIDRPPLMQARVGSQVQIPVRLSLFSGATGSDLTLRWRLDTVDERGYAQSGFTAGSRRVSCDAYRVQDMGPIEIQVPTFPHLGTVHIWVADAAGKAIARNFVQIRAVAAPEASGDVRPETLPGGSRWQPPVQIYQFPLDLEHPAEARWDAWKSISEDVLVGMGQGSFAFEVQCELPPDAVAPKRAELIFEAAAGAMAPPQTDVYRTPTVVRVLVDGDQVATVRLPDAPADNRGALSWAAGLQGQYGYVTRLSLPEEVLAKVNDGVKVVFAVDGSEEVNGLTLFGSDAGRYPVPCSIIVYL